MSLTLEPPGPIDTRAMFRPVSTSLVALLRGLPPPAWDRPTVAGAWLVRDVAAHLLDTTLRRLAFHRDGMAPPPPPHAIRTERELVGFINDLNAQWVAAARRLSPRVLTDLFERASGEAADWLESVPLEAPALFAVSWAGEDASAGWFDIGREFTELWHHREQIRIAVGDEAADDPRYLAAVIDVAVRGLPHAFRGVPAERGRTVAVEVTGAGGGRWTLERDHERWRLWRGAPASPTARVTMDAATAWKLLFNALRDADATGSIRIDGDAGLGRALLGARSVIV